MLFVQLSRHTSHNLALAKQLGVKVRPAAVQFFTALGRWFDWAATTEPQLKKIGTIESELEQLLMGRLCYDPELRLTMTEWLRRLRTGQGMELVLPGSRDPDTLLYIGLIAADVSTRSRIHEFLELLHRCVWSRPTEYHCPQRPEQWDVIAPQLARLAMAAPPALAVAPTPDAVPPPNLNEAEGDAEAVAG